MFNSIIKNLNGHGSEAASLDAALAQLARDRAETVGKIDALQRQRHSALLDDASDSDLDKLERLLDRATTRLEKLNMSEAPLRERLADAQTAARKRRWETLHADHHGASGKFLALARATLAQHKALISIVDQAQREGFAGLVASTMPRTPNIEGNPVLAEDLLDIFERSLAPPSARRSERTKPAKADPSLWDSKSPGYNHPTAVQLRTIMTPPGGSSLQHAVGAETTYTISPLKPAGKIHATKLEDDMGSLAAGEIRAVVLQRGYVGPDGGQSHPGRKIRMPLEMAKLAARNGAIEILNEAPIPANTNVGASAEGATR